MSLIFLYGVFMAANGKLDSSYLTTDYFTLWALFSIADALWIGRFSK